VDADDWIEQDTFKKVIEQSCDVDIIAFGRWKDSPKTKIAWSPSISEVTIDQNEAIKRLIVENTIKPAIWDKIYRREMFNDVRFPEGYNYEEIRTTYKPKFTGIFSNYFLPLMPMESCRTEPMIPSVV
jgi:hypothetical protein